MNKVNIAALVFAALISMNTYGAQSNTSVKQVIKLKATIVGAKEQPQFLSIVPWRKLKSPVIEVQKETLIINKPLTVSTPKQIKIQQQLTTYLKGRYKQ